jgi:anti-sigma B factor antagonist
MTTLSVTEKTVSDQAVTLSLTGDLTIHSEETWHPLFDPYVEKGKDLTLNLAEVESVDTTGIQLLLCMSIAQRKAGRSLQVEGLNTQLTEDFSALGLTEIFS